jgi:hypothetical protein
MKTIKEERVIPLEWDHVKLNDKMVVAKRSSARTKKFPANRSSDFLWGKVM